MALYDEILELLYLKEEENAPIRQAEIGEQQPGADGTLQAMASAGLIEIGDDGVVTLTDAGRAHGRQIVRRHRLAERLLVDALDPGADVMEQGACTFEHMVSQEVTDSICTLLGHPPTCPHGKPIPPGDCCKRAAHGVVSLVMPLTDLPCGKDARVLYISTRHHDRLDRLASMGLLPGVDVRLHQSRPSYVIQVGETTLAIDQSVAKDIFVRQK
ncbi:MAG TPA: metal-dependent transcriptional regulator [Planctomycetota bacterium]|nr:metal-dependent transcriptional regulator [Planctomycetota bacterium]